MGVCFREKRNTDPWEMRIYFKVSLVMAVIDEDVTASSASQLAKGQGTS